MTELKLILFDLDDTLCDYAGARALRLRCAFTTAFEAISNPVTPDYDLMIEESIRIHPHGADHFPDLLARHGVADPKAAQLARSWYQTNRFHGLSLFGDAMTTLDRARGTNQARALGLITNGPADVQRAKIELLGVAPHFDFIVISGEFGIAKPEAPIFEHALKQAGADAGETLFVGDSPEFDIAGANLLGMRTAWVNRTGRPWGFSVVKPDIEVSNLTALHPSFGGETE